MEWTFLQDLRKYRGKTLVSDFFAAITVAIILVPQGMAYSLLAGLPPIYGLYAAIIPMIIYPIFASSRKLSIGPVALMAIIIFAGVSVFAEPGSQKYLDMVLMTTILSGMIQVLFAVFRLGKLARFISTPVMNGFISAAGIIIAISQLKYLLALNLGRKTSIVSMLTDIANAISEANVPSAILGISSIALIIVLKRISRKIPAGLIVVIISSVLCYFFNFSDMGISSIGDMPKGLPNFYAGFLNPEYILQLLPTALIISFVCFMGSYALAKTFASDSDEEKIFPNKELLGLGIAKIVSSFFLAMPSTGSFSRSAINSGSGAKTGLSSIFTAILVGLTLMFFGPLFYYLPIPVLAAIVITSVISLIKLKNGVTYFKLDKRDFISYAITLLCTLFLGIVYGIILGIIISNILTLVFRHR